MGAGSPGYAVQPVSAEGEHAAQPGSGPAAADSAPVEFAPERQERIAALVERERRIRVADLAERYAVSAVTIRKDLLALESRGRLVRTHGGAIASAAAGRPEPAFAIREQSQRSEKAAIAGEAVGLIRDGDSVVLDASTTALALARLLRQRSWTSLTVITNGIRAALELADVPGVDVLVPGGRIRSGALSVVGTPDDGLLGRVNIAAAFVGALGVTPIEGLTDGTEDEAQIKRSMCAAAREVHALVDHTKWGRVATASFCGPDRLTGVITGPAAPADHVAAMRALGIVVTIVHIPGSGAVEASE